MAKTKKVKTPKKVTATKKKKTIKSRRIPGKTAKKTVRPKKKSLDIIKEFKKYFAQFDDNLQKDKFINGSERSQFYSHLNSCPLIKKHIVGGPTIIKKTLGDHCNNKFLWERKKSKRLRQLQGPPASLWTSSESLGAVIEKTILRFEVCQATKKIPSIVDNIFREIIKESKFKLTNRLDRFKSDLRTRFKDPLIKNELSIMWSYRNKDFSKSILHNINKDDLPYLLALPYAAPGKEFYIFGHRISKSPKVPRTFDTNIDNDLFRPGGSTYPIGRCKGQPGLPEIVHEPNNISNISNEFTNIILS